MKFRTNVPLARYTSLRVGGPAKYFCLVRSVDELREAIKFAKSKKLPFFVLGEGSNTIFSDNGFEGLVIKNEIKGIELIRETKTSVLLSIGSGENLDKTIAQMVKNGWTGIENLSFVPGTVGAMAVQNVNAYGHDASKIINSVRVLDFEDGLIKVLRAGDCKFRYRQSIFNSDKKDRYFVIQITLKLSKIFKPLIEYPDLVKYFENIQTDTITPSTIRRAVIKIRRHKGLDLNEYLSAGSIFKNLILTESEFTKLRGIIINKYGVKLGRALVDLKDKFASVEKHYSSITGISDISRVGKIKIPVAFILDKILHFKGSRYCGAYISKKKEFNVLLIINDGSATASDVQNLIQAIKDKVKRKLGLDLNVEPEIV